MAQAACIQVVPYDDVPVADLGSISIRVFVLPPKPDGKDAADEEPDESPDLAEKLTSTPLNSYLEQGKGGRKVVVFCVNGQRQESLDPSFVVQDLGFKYLRSRLIIMVDVDGLAPEAIGRLMQGTRQTFYHGEIWDAVRRRLVATLKSDPDLRRLESEAAERVSELKAGDDRVRQTLDQLIDNHHDRGSAVVAGPGIPGVSPGDVIGPGVGLTGEVVSLLPPSQGQPAGYPVLISRPGGSHLRIRPEDRRRVEVETFPTGAWSSLSSISVEPDKRVPELGVVFERGPNSGILELSFQASKDTIYPVEAAVTVTATFNGIKTARQLSIEIVIKPDRVVVPPVLLDAPSTLKIVSRRPVHLHLGDSDCHVQLRWDGKDGLLVADEPSWRMSAELVTPGQTQPRFGFSTPRDGRFSLLVAPDPSWCAGDHLDFKVEASGPNGEALQATFEAEVVDPPQTPVSRRGPRSIDAPLGSGGNRRPPYVLKIIKKENYDTPCWGLPSWSDQDSGSYVPPTEQMPLVLMINEDMTELVDFKTRLTSKHQASYVKQELNRYQSAVAFHLYQMYLATLERKETDLDAADRHRRDEIRRLALTMMIRNKDD